MQTLGVAIIARNSEKTIKNCIESFKEYAQQIVVVLAGESTDKTEEIVNSIEGVKLVKMPPIIEPDWVKEILGDWDGTSDFAMSRNFSLSYLNTDWNFWVDSDDEVYRAEILSRLINEAKEEVGAIWLPYHYAIDEFGNVNTVYERERLLRAKYGWVWKGRLHETVSPIQKCVFVRNDDVIIKHNHTAGGSRNDRNFKLLNIMLKEDPNDKRVWLYMGHQNFAAGNWMDAAEWYLKFGTNNEVVALERYQALCYASKALREMNDSQSIDTALSALSLFPEYRDAYLELAHSYLTNKDYEKAIHWAKLSDTKEIIKEPPRIIFVNPMDYTFNKYALLSECYLRLGDVPTALDYVLKAYEIRPCPDIKHNWEYLKNMEVRGRVVEAIKVLAVVLHNNKELTKLKSLLDCTPYWFRDTDDYKQLEGGMQKYLEQIKDDTQVAEGENKSAMVNLANCLEPDKTLEDMDKKYDKVMITCPYPSENSKQVNVYSQRDMENLIMSGSGRHIINLQKENDRIICEYDKNQPNNLAVRIFLGQGLEYWSPKTIREVGCGGSETVAAYIGKELAARNCQPIIYAMDNQIWDGVIYRKHQDYNPNSIGCHLFISSRVPDVFNNDIDARQKWLWFHDISCWDRLTPELAERIDVFVALSHWHVGHIKRSYPWLKDAEVIDLDNNKVTYDDLWTSQVYRDGKVNKLPRIAIIGNGIDTSRYKNISVEKKSHRFIWCSSPDRGLRELLEMWSLIKKRLPDAELKIFYGWEYFDTSLWIPAQREFKQKIRKLIQQDGVEWCGRIGQVELANEQMKADALIYPPHDFRETYGIAFLEAQAANVICFYRQNGALGETIGDRGIPLSLDMKPEEIINTVVSVLENRELCDNLRKAGREYAMNRDWAEQTDKVLTLYERMEMEKNGS